MRIPKEETDALRRCLVILAPHHTPGERQMMALNIEQYIRGDGAEFLSFEFKQIATLFYPSNRDRADALAVQMQQAYDRKELVTIAPESLKSALLTDLITWADCPPVPLDSPLRYLLPEWMHETQTTKTGAANNGKTIQQSAAVIEATTHKIEPESAQKIRRYKLRKNSLDAPIEKAIEQAGSLDTAAVYLELRELALNGEKPFTGDFEDDALCYTNDNNKPDKLTKNALDKRLKSRRT